MNDPDPVSLPLFDFLPTSEVELEKHSPECAHSFNKNGN